MAIPTKEEALNHDFAHPLRTGMAAGKLTEIMREDFPQEFKSRLAFSQMKDPKTMTRWLLEYRKFMLMCFMAQEDTLYPSYQVHQVW